MEVSKKEIQVLEKQATPLIKKAVDYKIKSVEDVEKASIILKQLSDTIKVIEAKRLEFTKPLNQSLTAINASFKQVKAPLITTKAFLSSRIMKWRRVESERIEKEEARRRKIQEAHEKKGHEVKAPVIMERPQKSVGHFRTRKVWTFEVVNFTKVPNDYKEIDRVQVNAAIRLGERKIPGIRIYQKEQPSIV